MALKIVERPNEYLVVDTNTHRVIGRHDTKEKAQRHRRHARLAVRLDKPRRK